MKSIKKITTLLLATLATLSLGLASACSGGGDDASYSQSSSTSENSSSQGNSPAEEEMCTNDRPHSYAWETSDVADAANPDRIAKEVGQCTVCGKMAVMPTLPTDQAFPSRSADAENDGYHPLDLEEGCYTLEIPDNGELWVCFSAEEVGQFAFYSIGGSSCTVDRYNAEIGFTCFLGAHGKTVENDLGDDFYSFVNRSEENDGSNWRSLYCITGESGALIKVCFTRIASPMWEPQTAITMVYPTEINGKKASDSEAGKQLIVVDFDSNYYFDETDGYYHRGTPDKPGEVIYAAITAEASRMFEGSTFATVLSSIGTALNVQDGYTADGDYNVLCYIPFISNCADDTDPNKKDEDGNPILDTSKNCYMNYCNSDGVYPVTRELYKFLNVYVRSHTPIGVETNDPDLLAEKARPWAEHKNENGADADRNKFWLAACYTYETIALGVEANPHALTVGDNAITVPAKDSYYVTLPDGVYSIVCEQDVKMYYGVHNFTAPVNVVVDGGVKFRFTMGTTGGSATVRVTKLGADADGYVLDTAIPLLTLGDVTLAVHTVYDAEGATYFAYYSYTPTAEGSFSFTLTGDANATVTIGNDTVVNELSPTATLSVTANQGEFETLYVYVAANESTDITANLAFTSAE